jgi:hypothetical protein
MTGEPQIIDARPTLFELEPAPDFLAQIEPAVEHIRSFVHGGAGPYTKRIIAGEGKPTSKSVVWQKTPLKEASLRLISVMSGLIANRAAPLEEQEAGVSAMIEAHIAHDSQVDPQDLPFLGLRAMASAERVRRLRELSADLSDTLGDVVREPRQQFELMKLLATEEPSTTPLNLRQQQIGSLQIVYTFGNLDPESTGAPYPDKALTAGEFDSFIAEELLAEVVQSDESELKGGRADLRNQLELLIAAFQPQSLSVEEAIAKLSDPETMQRWPESAKRELKQRVAQYGEALRTNRADDRKYLDSHQCIVPSSSEEDVRRAADSVVHEIVTQRSANSKLSTRERIAAGAMRAERKRRTHRPRRRARDLGAAAMTGSQESESEGDEAAKPPRRSLAFILPSGEHAPEGSEEHEAELYKYLEDHRDQQSLAADLAEVKEHLRDIDFSSGRPPRGVQKLPVANAKRGGTELGKVYMLRVADAVNLSTQSAVGTELAVLFTQNKDAIGLIAVAEKDQMSRIRTSLGLRGSSSRTKRR